MVNFHGPRMVAVVTSMGNMLQGWDGAALAGALLYIKPEFHLEDKPIVYGSIVATTLVGAMLSTIIVGRGADYMGRLPMLRISAFLYCLGSLCMAWSPSIYTLLMARLVVGCGIGIVVTLSPLFISEIAPSEIRGELNTYPQFAGSGGMFIAYCMVFGISLTTTTTTTTTTTSALPWRLMLGILFIPSFIYLVFCIIYLPESPKWLERKGRGEEAKNLLRLLHNEDQEDASGLTNPLLPTQRQELVESPCSSQSIHNSTIEDVEPIQATPVVDNAFECVEEDDQHHHSCPISPRVPTLADLFKGGVKGALIVGIGLQVLQQFAGINAVLYFTPQILKQSGVEVLLANMGINSDSSSLLVSVITSLLMLPTIILAMRLMDNMGRRKILLFTIPVLIFSLLALVIINLVPLNPTIFALISIVSVVLYICFFVMGFGPIPNIICAEIFPTHVRGVYVGICQGTMWICDILVTELFPTMDLTMGIAGAFGLFTIVCVISWLFVFLKVPETKGIELEHIDDKGLLMRRKIKYQNKSNIPQKWI